MPRILVRGTHRTAENYPRTAASLPVRAELVPPAAADAAGLRVGCRHGADGAAFNQPPLLVLRSLRVRVPE